MSEPSVVMVIDADGNVHWTSPNSTLAKEATERAAQDAPKGDDHDASETDSGSGDGITGDTGTTRGARRSGKAEPSSGS